MFGDNLNKPAKTSYKPQDQPNSLYGKNKPYDKFEQLVYKINDVSSEDEGYPATELLNHTPYSRGWQSARFCQYPQEITLEFGQTVRVRQIQFLSHQYKISTKIELMIFNQGQTKKFKKIGFLALDSNERSNFQARELKSVYIDNNCQKLKIVLNKCHVNAHNIFSQVGLISINVKGEFVNEQNLEENPQQAKNQEMIAKNKAEIDTYEDSIKYDPVTMSKLKSLNVQKDEAISREDFDQAQNIKNAIDRLKSVANQLTILEQRKQIAVKNDQFDEAKLIKNEIENLRNQALNTNPNQNPYQESRGQSGTNSNKNFKKLARKEDPYNNQPNNYQNFEGEENNFQDDGYNNNNYDYSKERANINSNQSKRNNKINQNRNNNNQENFEYNNQNDYYNENANENNEYNYEENAENKNEINIPPSLDSNSRRKPASVKSLKKEEENKPPVNVENIKVGNEKNFEDMIEEQMKIEKENKRKKQIDDDNTGETDDISEKEYPIAEPLISVFGYDNVKLLFAKNWKNKEEGVKLIKSEIIKYPRSSAISKSNTPIKVLIGAMGVGEYILGGSNPQPSIAVNDMLMTCIDKFKNENLASAGHGKQDFITKTEKVMGLLMEKGADANIKLKESSEILINEFADSSLVGEKVVLNYLNNAKVKKSLTNSAKYLSSRMNLLKRNIEFFTVEPVEDLDNLIKYSVTNFQNANKDVRDNAFSLIMTIYKFIGDDIKKHFKTLRQAQATALEEGFDEVEVIGMNPQNKKSINNKTSKGFGNNNNEKEEMGNSRVKSQKGRTNEISQSQVQVQEEQEPEEENYQQEENQQNEENEENQACSFCGYYDENFDEDNQALHLFKQCPWCKQTVEICSLNSHYINECTSKKDFRVCSRCKEPIIVNLYEKHIAEKSCLPAKNQNVANRCPLCHTDVEPPGKKGWEIHLLEEGCPGNPRNQY